MKKTFQRSSKPRTKRKDGDNHVLYFLSPWFDAHVHLRGPDSPWCPEAFKLNCESVAKQCQFAVVMPNAPIIKTVAQMRHYREQILQVTSQKYPSFYPLMTAYLTPDTSIVDIQEAAKLPWFAGWKFYPQGVTTGSEAGTADVRQLEKVLAAIQDVGSKLLIHGEKIDVDPLCAEETFIREDLPLIRQMFKGKIVLEHCSTVAAVRAVLFDENMWGTITPHHLIGDYSQTDNPHNRCKPVWQTIDHRNVLLAAIASSQMLGQTKFFAGTDTAMHFETQKLLGPEAPNGCFSSPVALPLYFQALVNAPWYDDIKDQLRDYLTRFLFQNAADFYEMPQARWIIANFPTVISSITIRDKPALAPSADDYKFYDKNRNVSDRIVPLLSGQELEFSVEYR